MKRLEEHIAFIRRTIDIQEAAINLQKAELAGKVTELSDAMSKLRKETKAEQIKDISDVLSTVNMSCKWSDCGRKIKVYTGLKPHSQFSNEWQKKTTLVWSSCSSEMLRRLVARIIELEDNAGAKSDCITTAEKQLWAAIDHVISLFPNHYGMEDALDLLKIQRNKNKPRHLQGV